jgi:hypothetical protein
MTKPSPLSPLSPPSLLWLLLASLAPMAPCAQAAETGYYLVSTYPNGGEATVDFKYWRPRPEGEAPRSSPELGLGYNVNDSWFTELSAAWFARSPGSQHFAALEWQNDVLLTHGQYDVDVALHTRLTHRTGSRALGLEVGPVLQTEMGRTQINFNAFLQRDYRTDAPALTELAYQWQLRRHWRRAFQFGLQGFGEVGKWDHWLPRRAQSHRAGPAIFGTIGTGRNQELRYDAAYLVGKNSARTAHSVTVRIQYVFR